MELSELKQPLVRHDSHAFETQTERRSRALSMIHESHSEQLPPDLSSRLPIHTYWIDLVNRLGFDRSVYATASIPNLDLLSRYFDSTQLGMLRVFHLFDKDFDNNLTFEEIAWGLKQQGIFTLSGSTRADAAFSELCDLLVAGEQNRVRPPEFLAVLKNLRLAGLFASQPEELKINIHEYREDQLFSSCPLDNPINFLFSQNAGNTNFRVRWIHLHESTRAEILGITMKYGLDPRFVLDVFTLWREQAKSDQVSKYEGSNFLELSQIGHVSPDKPLWFFVVVPVLRLSAKSKQAMQPYQAWKRLKMKKTITDSDLRREPPPMEIVVEHCNLAMFVSGEAEGGTVVSFSSDWVDLMKFSTMRDDKFPAKQDFPTPEVASVNYTSCEIQDLSVFSKMLGQLRTSYSRLRTGDAHTFLLRTLCDVTEDYIAVTMAFDAVLSVLQKRLDKDKDKLNAKDLKRIQKSVVQLSTLFRLVRPVSSLVDTFTNKQWSGDALLYVSDIRSNVLRFMDDTVAMKENAKMLVDRFHQYSNSKTSSVLYALTLVTTVFVPGQFLTSLYGMNFQNPLTGKPGMPELYWEHGYAFFWLVNIIITSFTFFYYRKQEWI